MDPLLKELLDKEREYINYFFDHLDAREVEGIVDLLAACEGVMIFTGVGKSGLVAEKIAMTMTSSGSRAFYISPNNALHGDIGIVSDKDVVVMLSKSGESDELLSLIPTLRNKQTKLVAIVNAPNSRLAKSCDLSIHLPLKRELCPYDMVPTTSMVIQMIFGDVLAIALMRLKNFSLDQYALNHPGGRIGKRLSLKVNDLMLKGTSVPTCSPHDKLVDTLVELSNKRCGCVLIVDEAKKLQGIFTDGDLRRSLQKHGAIALESSMGELMTKTARSITPHHMAWEAMKEMESDQKNAITILPVLDEQKVVGVIKLHDIVQSGL